MGGGEVVGLVVGTSEASYYYAYIIRRLTEAPRRTRKFGLLRGGVVKVKVWGWKRLGHIFDRLLDVNVGIVDIR